MIGCEIRLSPEVIRGLRKRREPMVLSAAERGLQALLEYHREAGAPRAESVLLAPLFVDGELLGLLKIAGTERGAFVGKDREVVERFLPAAAVSLRNVQVKQSLEQQAMAAELRASLVTLARAVAHDVNNAIGAILPMAEQAREDVLAGRIDKEGLAQDLQVIVDKAQLCKRIFSNMLRAGAERPGGGRLDLNLAVREMMPLLEAQAAPRAITLRAELAEDVPLVRFSRLHLDRVIWNLVTNAVEAFGEKAGAITVTTAAAAGAGAVVRIRDDGPGLPPEVLSRIGEPFFSTKPSGTGLGLAICRALARQYGGTLDLASTPGRGTEVSVRLAAAAEEP
jgi:signal transduction histidine kinase